MFREYDFLEKILFFACLTLRTKAAKKEFSPKNHVKMGLSWLSYFYQEALRNEGLVRRLCG